jgi:hypothetical protein
MIAERFTLIKKPMVGAADAIKAPDSIGGATPDCPSAESSALRP